MTRPFLALALAASVLGAAPALAQKVELDTTAGKIVLQLDAAAAPKTVENFLAYVKAKHYDGTQFHRVIANFMIQGGGYTASFDEKITRPGIQNEAEQALKAGLRNVVGTVAMARTNDPHSASAQFFINVRDNAFLDFKSADPRGYGYTVFGKVVDGMDVVNRIASAPKGATGPIPRGMNPADVPAQQVLINKATVVEPK